MSRTPKERLNHYCANSLSGSPMYAAELRHTVRSVGAVTQALGRLRHGDRVGLRGPFGTAGLWPRPKDTTGC